MIQHAPARIVALNGPATASNLDTLDSSWCVAWAAAGLSGGPPRSGYLITRRATRWNKPVWDASGRRHRPVAVIKRVQTFKSADHDFFVPDFGHIEPLELPRFAVRVVLNPPPGLVPQRDRVMRHPSW